MTFKQQWEAQTLKAKGLRRRRMEMLSRSPRVMRYAEQLAKDKYGDGAINWAELLAALLPMLLKIFGL